MFFYRPQAFQEMAAVARCGFAGEVSFFVAK
jgi:hypothetical protein